MRAAGVGQAEEYDEDRGWARREEGCHQGGPVCGALNARLNVHLLRISYIPGTSHMSFTASPLLQIL